LLSKRGFNRLTIILDPKLLRSRVRHNTDLMLNARTKKIACVTPIFGGRVYFMSKKKTFNLAIHLLGLLEHIGVNVS
jgi:hypothetical protein